MDGSARLPLRDIHLPEAIGWWPPAPGWWLLTVSMVLIVLLLHRGWRRLRARRYGIRAQARARFQALRQEYARSGDQGQLVRGLSVLLRRACLSVYPRTEVAGLAGERWLKHLDRGLGDGRFQQGTGSVLAQAPYRREVEVDVENLLALCAEWIDRLPDGGHPTRR